MPLTDGFKSGGVLCNDSLFTVKSTTSCEFKSLHRSIDGKSAIHAGHTGFESSIRGQ